MGHIESIEIKNFKKFQHLRVENLGLLNLVTGDNNAGKTTLLEGLVILQDSIDKSIEYLHRTLCLKRVHIHPQHITSQNPIVPVDNYFRFLKNDLQQPLEFYWVEDRRKKKIAFQDCVIDELNENDFSKQKPNNYNISNTRNWIKVFVDGNFSELQWMYLDDFKRGMQYGYWELISFSAGYDHDINHYFAETIGLSETSNSLSTQILGIANSQIEFKFKTLDFEQKKSFISALSMFIFDIEDITIKNYFGRDLLAIKVCSLSDYQPITFWGEGFNKFVRYLLEIVRCKGKRILIDEIDTGIHWTKLISFWSFIIQSCKANSVQLFATTHSQECINAFLKAAEMVNAQDDLRLVELEEFIVDRNTKHSATTYDFETLKYKVEADTNVRGGDVWK